MDTPVIPLREAKLGLNVGSGTKRIKRGGEHWINLDSHALPGVDVVRDLRRGLPFSDNTFDLMLCDNVLEHFVSEDAIFLLNEMDRVLKVSGRLTIIVPHWNSHGAYQDPTHKSYWSPRSALYWNQTDSAYGGVRVGITASLYPIHEPVIYGDTEHGTEVFIRFELIKRPVPELY